MSDIYICQKLIHLKNEYVFEIYVRNIWISETYMYVTKIFMSEIYPIIFRNL